MTNLPQVPKLPYISGKTLFEDDEKAKEWFTILQKRKAVLCKLEIRQHQCMQETS